LLRLNWQPANAGVQRSQLAGGRATRRLQERPMRTHRFGRKIKLPATIAIKHQLRKLMFEDAVKKAEAGARAEAIRGQLREETRPLVQSG
jgi:hypothetical protein